MDARRTQPVDRRRVGFLAQALEGGMATFGNWSRKACQTADFPARPMACASSASRAAENGATGAQLNAIFGWEEGSRESATDVKRASRAKWARSAMTLLLPNNPEAENPAPLARCGISRKKSDDFKHLENRWCPGEDRVRKLKNAIKSTNQGSPHGPLCITFLEFVSSVRMGCHHRVVSF